MELTATFSVVDVVAIEAVGPVDTHQTHHGKIDAHAETGTAFHVEGIEFAGVIPRVSGLNKPQSIDGGVAKHQGIAQLHGETVVGIAL